MNIQFRLHFLKLSWKWIQTANMMAIPSLKICYAAQATWDYLISIWITWVGVSAFGIEMHQPRIIRNQIAFSCNKQVKYLTNAKQADIHRKCSNWPSIVTSNKSINSIINLTSAPTSGWPILNQTLRWKFLTAALVLPIILIRESSSSSLWKSP